MQLRIFSRNNKSLNLCRVLLLAGAIIAFSSALAHGVDDAESTQDCPIGPVTFSLCLFVICLIIGIVAVLAGVGGGVMFTPLFMGFTAIDSYIVRSTGLFVALAGALVAARPFLRQGIVNIRLLYTAGVPYTLFAALGAVLAGYLYGTGAAGEMFIRGALGVIVLGIACLFVFFGGKMEYPQTKRIDAFTSRLDLALPYWEQSLGKVVHYAVTRAHIGMVLFCGVGFISGLFGMGAGWAIVPVFNMVMLAPLKVAATSSVVLISIGDTAAVWPYVCGGGMFPLFAIPSMMGVMSGTYIGSKIMLQVKAGFVRWVVIVVMFAAGVRLIIKSLDML